MFQLPFIAESVVVFPSLLNLILFAPSDHLKDFLLLSKGLCKALFSADCWFVNVLLSTVERAAINFRGATGPGAFADCGVRVVAFAFEGTAVLIALSQLATLRFDSLGLLTAVCATPLRSALPRQHTLALREAFALLGLLAALFPFPPNLSAFFAVNHFLH